MSVEQLARFSGAFFSFTATLLDLEILDEMI
jgi:hypothetical protein